MKEFFRPHWSKQEQVAALTMLVAINCVFWAEFAYFMDRAGIAPWQTNLPEPAGAASSEITDDLLPTTIFPSRTPTRVLPPAETQQIFRDQYKIGPFNFRSGEATFIFARKKDGKLIKSYFYPTEYKRTDDFNKVFNPFKKINASFLNVTDPANPDRDILIQTIESGSAPIYGDLSGESWRKELEENGRPFNPAEFKKTVDDLKASEIIILQGKLAAGKTEADVDETGKGLVNPVRATAKIKGIMRLDPGQTATKDRDQTDAYKSGGYTDVFRYVDSNKQVVINPQDINPKTDFLLELCGQKTFPGEKRVPGVKQVRTTRFFTAFSVSK